MSTIGVSTERGVVRAVLLSNEPSGEAKSLVLNRGEELAGYGTPKDTGDAVVSILDAMEADLGGHIDGAAVAYRDARERSAIVSSLASGKWSASSMVSAKSAQLAAVQKMPGLGHFRNILVYEAVPGSLTYSVVDATRTRVLGSGAFSVDTVSAASVGDSVRQAWSTLDGIDAKPDAVVVLGSLADDPNVTPVLENGFGVPVLHAPETATATAFGAALLAARDIPSADSTVVAGGGAPAHLAGAAGSGSGNTKRVVLAAATVGILGAAGLAAWGITSGSSPKDEAAVPSPAQAASGSSQPGGAMAGATGIAQPVVPAASPAAPIAAPPPAAPAPAPAAPVMQVQDPVTGVWTPVPTPAWTPEAKLPPAAPAWTAPQAPVVTKEAPVAQPPVAAPAPPAPPAAPSTVGEPGPNLLFPGEAPPPPLGADPAQAQKWWDNHWELKDRWIHHN